MSLTDGAAFHNGAWYDRDGRPVGKPDSIKLSTTLVASGVVVPGVAGKKIKVLGFILSSLLATNVKFQSSTGSVDISATHYLAATGGYSVPETGSGWFETLAAGDSLNLNMSVATGVGVTVIYVLTP